MEVKIGFIGFGTVGRGFAEILVNKKEYLSERYGIEWKVVAIADPVWGMIHNPDGIDLKKAVELVDSGQKIESLGETGWDSIKVARESEADVIVEVTPTNIKNGEPGLTHIREALSAKKHVITTNKGPIALAYKELKALADSNGVKLGFEGTVLAGTPALNLARWPLGGVYFEEVRGIVNGTTNYILTNMEAGRSYEEVLKEAQKLGYAEADPTADVEGFDAMAKVLILANVLFDANLKVDDVERVGITHLTVEDIEKAKSEGKRWKLLAKVWREGDVVKAKVSPEMVGKNDPLFHIMGVTNALVFKTDHLGEVTIIGPGAGRTATGHALLADLIEIFGR
ncbi:MAG: homoserine dehydrogenase [Candidatus Hydrothermota bacterium]|nr:MAG: homoserine dehydrogenase [Candidatus Hydrothermae bacterium]